MNALKSIFSKFNSKETNQKKSPLSLYDIKIKLLNDKPLDLKAFKGKYILFVNVASKCGFTKQYKDLQALHLAYHDKLQVIGVPCNQFGNQEPGNAQEITNFCQINYGVSFPITEKIKVKGNNKHKLYQFLTDKKNNGVKSSSVKWNFQKYLVNPKGELVDYFLSTTDPKSSKITNHLK